MIWKNEFLLDFPLVMDSFTLRALKPPLPSFWSIDDIEAHAQGQNPKHAWKLKAVDNFFPPMLPA